MKRSKGGKRIENKEHVQMKNLIGEEEMIGIGIEKEINVVGVMMIKADMTQAVTGIIATHMLIYYIKLLRYDNFILLIMCRNSGHRSRSRSRDKHDRHRDDDHRRHARDKGK